MSRQPKCGGSKQADRSAPSRAWPARDDAAPDDLDGVRHRRQPHLSADDVFGRTRARPPEISRATVYNALRDFVAAGLLGLVLGSGPQLYDANAEPHHHFGCRRCGQLFDVHPNSVGRMKLAERGFRLERTKVLLEGLLPAMHAV